MARKEEEDKCGRKSKSKKSRGDRGPSRMVERSNRKEMEKDKKKRGGWGLYIRNPFFSNLLFFQIYPIISFLFTIFMILMI